ncbi:hypothetical protein N9W28_03610 [Alphaproteobacteria bacterium]|nr:hypothetical protein [Alphaproteobacteria bacterium]
MLLNNNKGIERATTEIKRGSPKNISIRYDEEIKIKKSNSFIFFSFKKE